MQSRLCAALCVQDFPAQRPNFRGAHKKETREHWFRIGLIASILVAMVAYVTLATSQDDKKWGFGIIGTIVGYAIRGPL